MDKKNEQIIGSLELANQKEAMAAMSKKLHIEQETKKLLRGEPYDKLRIRDDIKQDLTQHIIKGIDAGRKIYAIKINENHGDFIRVIEDIGINLRTAQKYMATYIKFSNTSALTYLNSTKLMSALSIPDEEIAKMESEGHLIGIPLADLKILSTREFEAEIKKWKKRTETTEKREAEKDKKIAELQKKIDDIFDPYANDIEKNIEDRAHKIFLSVKGDLIQIRHIADAMGQNPDAFTEASKSQLCGLMDMLLRVTAEFREQVNHCCWSVTEDAIPDTETLRSVPIQGKWNKDLAPEAYDIEPGVFNNLEPKTDN